MADVLELVEHGSETVVIGRGQNGQLQITTEAREWLDNQGIALEILNSTAAVNRYNALSRGGAAVGALVHSTC